MIVWLLILLSWAASTAQTSRPTINLWLVSDHLDDAVSRGAKMGAEEMNRTATLLGRHFALREVLAPTPAAAREALATARGRVSPVFVLLDVEASAACEIARDFAGKQDIIVLHARVVMSECPAQWLQLRVPDDRRARLLSQVGDEGTRVDEWHESLQRFGASELNERYERRTHGSMDGDAWAGWFAAKMAAEAALRLDRVDRAALVGSGAPSFDGHKGAPLRFDSQGILQQPVYIIDRSGTRVLKEIR